MNLEKRILKWTGRFFATLSVAMVAMGTAACNGNLENGLHDQEMASVLSLSIVPETKATGSLHGVQADDNYVHSLEIFIFKDEGPDAGVLDTYKKLAGAELGSLENIQVQTTTGKKIIYAVANSHIEEWTGVNRLEQFQSVLASLEKEDLKSFTMVGSTRSLLGAASSVNIDVVRLVARVHLSGIKTDFEGTPYEGAVLKNVKAYLINVTGNVCYANGAVQENSRELNSGELNSDDVKACIMDGMLYDYVADEIGDSGYNSSHYFYCYENLILEENDDQRFTRLVIQADLNGTTYYYPININRDGYGYTSANGHAGVRRNTSYSIDVTITRPGTLDPDISLDFGEVTAKLSVLDWATLPVANVGF